MQNAVQSFVQKPVQMFVQSFVQIVMQKRWLTRQNEVAMLYFVSNWFGFGSLRYKSASMQKDSQNLVQMSVQKHGAERRWRPVQVAVQSLMQMLVQIIVQKNGTDAEMGCRNRAVIGAEGFAEHRAEIYAEVRAVRRAESLVLETRKLRAVCYVVSRGGESQNS